MATVVIIVKIMPESPTVDLGKIKDAAKKALEPEGAKNISFEEKPVAFGLKSLHMKMDMPEERGTDLVESTLSKLPQVSSVTIEDYRRAFGWVTKPFGFIPVLKCGACNRFVTAGEIREKITSE